jgi:hypothetical protein
MTPTIVSSIPELLQTIRQRRDELSITNATIDDIAGLTDRHTSKILAAHFPSRNLGRISFPAVLGALGLGIGAIVLLEDPEQVAAVSKRWARRKREILKTGQARIGAKLISRARPFVLKENARAANEARNRLLSSEQRSAIARKAALARWRKHRTRHREVRRSGV